MVGINKNKRHTEFAEKMMEISQTPKYLKATQEERGIIVEKIRNTVNQKWADHVQGSRFDDPPKSPKQEDGFKFEDGHRL